MGAYDLAPPTPRKSDQTEPKGLIFHSILLFALPILLRTFSTSSFYALSSSFFFFSRKTRYRKCESVFILYFRKRRAHNIGSSSYMAKKCKGRKKALLSSPLLQASLQRSFSLSTSLSARFLVRPCVLVLGVGVRNSP